jgi:uncharacterized protein
MQASSSGRVSLARPSISRDIQFFYDGLARHQLLIQRCLGCGHRRQAPGPMCPACQSTDWQTEERPLTGKIYTYIVHYHPPLPEHPTPHAVAIVELDDGTRVPGALARPWGTTQLGIGARVQTEFFETDSGFTFYQFRMLEDSR